MFLERQCLWIDRARVTTFGERQQSAVPTDHVDTRLVLAALCRRGRESPELAVQHSTGRRFVVPLRGRDKSCAHRRFPFSQSVLHEKGIAIEEMAQFDAVVRLLSGRYSVEFAVEFFWYRALHLDGRPGALGAWRLHRQAAKRACAAQGAGDEPCVDQPGGRQSREAR